MYHSAENGYLDIVLELRNLGVPWTLYTWYQTLSAAYNMRRRSITHNMLKDFSTCRHDDYNTEFIYDALPLLMDILNHSKVKPPHALFSLNKSNEMNSSHRNYFVKFTAIY